MSWRVAMPPRGGAIARDTAYARVNKDGRLVIGIGGGLAKILGWVRGNRIQLSFGIDTDAGKIRIEVCPDGGYHLSTSGCQRGASLRVVLKAPDFLAANTPGAAIGHRLIEDGASKILELTLPERWLRASASSAKRNAPGVQRNGAQAAR